MNMSNILTVAGLILVILISVPGAFALSATVHVPEKYTDVEVGERLYFEIEVKYPENPTRKDLRLEYKILDSEDNLIAQSKVLKAVETQASFIDFIVIPKSAKSGLHIIKVKVQDYESLSEEVESSFNVTNGSAHLETYFYILVGLIVVIGLAISLEFYALRKNQ